MPAYQNRDWVRQQFDPRLVEALDSIAQGSVSVGSHIAATPNVVTHPPQPPSSLSVVFASGVFKVTLTDSVNPPAGLHYMLDYSTSQQFANFQTLDLGISKTYQQNWGAQTLYFRAWAKYTASSGSGFTYFGSATNPTPITGTASGGTGTVTSVGAAAPITTTGGTAPVIGINVATSSVVGAVKPDNVTITVSGGVITATAVGAVPGPYADDTVAAGAGVAIGSPYYLASGFVVIRQV